VRLNQGLQSNKVTRIILEEMFEFPAPLNQFLDRLEKRFEYKEFSFVKDRYWLVASKLQQANQNFDEAIKQHPRLLDAYYEKIRIALDMDWRTEVIRHYEVARVMPVANLRPDSREPFNLDPLGPVLEETIFRIARIYYEEQDLVRNIRKSLETELTGEAPEEQAEAVIDTTEAAGQEPEAILLVQKFMADRKAILDGLAAQVEGDEEMTITVENAEIWNRFLLCRFYKNIGWRSESEGTFDKEKTKLGVRFVREKERYAVVASEMAQLERQVANMKRTVTVNFQVLGELVSKLGLRAKAAFYPQAESANMPVTVEDLEISMIPGLRNDVSFKKEITTELVTSQAISIPEGQYTVAVEIPSVPLQKENEFPIRFVHRYRNAQIPQYIQPELKFEVVDQKQQKQEISLPQGLYTQAAGALVDSDGDQVTFPSGTADVRAEADLQYLSDFGALFAFDIEKPGDLRIRGQEEALERMSKGLLGALVLMFFVL